VHGARDIGVVRREVLLTASITARGFCAVLALSK
jgi:hypothetical protein